MREVKSATFSNQLTVLSVAVSAILCSQLAVAATDVLLLVRPYLRPNHLIAMRYKR